MFSNHYQAVWNQLSEFSSEAAKVRCPLPFMTPPEYISLLWNREFGKGGELDQAILARSAEVKRALYCEQVFVIAPIYVTSICGEQCLYCNYRGGNKGIGVERRRLTDEELEREALFLIREKGVRVLELVYASDPRMRADVMCRHVELLHRVLDGHGGGQVGLSAEAIEESEYRSLVNAGLNWSVLWQETYDKDRYTILHPGKTRKADFDFRVNACERMLAAGVKHVGIGILSGLSDWRRDWAMLMRHEEYLTQTIGDVRILGIPRLKLAPGAPLREAPFLPSRSEFLAMVALHNLFSPATAPFVSTREDWDLCVELARGGGCLFTLNCSTTPGGYSLHHEGCQFTSHSYDAPTYATKLRGEGLEPVFNWKGQDLLKTWEAKAVGF